VDNDVSTTEDAQSEGQFFLHRRIVPEVGDHGFFAPSMAFVRDQWYHAKARSSEVSMREEQFWQNQIPIHN
jgi:hypothetical protein